MSWLISYEAPATPPPALDWERLPFGRIFSQHIALAYFQNGKWDEARIQPFQDFRLHPAIHGLHYGQALFEGMKAYQRPDGTRFVFRFKDHARRLNLSATRLSMPPVPLDLFEALLRELLLKETHLFPPTLRQAIYIRPFYFATDPYVGVRISESYLFAIFLSPVGPYYTQPVAAYVETEYSRAAPGGTGHIKMAGNYAAALISNPKAQAAQCQVTLWLDACEKRWVEEFSTMNVFFVWKDGRITTPALTRGTILAGITRDTILALLRAAGHPTEERDISIHEVIEGITSGHLTEVFGTGTAATIIPIIALHYQGKRYELPSTHPIAEKARTAYYELLSGNLNLNPDWIWKI
ncbi:MAG: branched-chain amino acid aminotransferase [Bacteroidota bacterium]|nr:branched-chain amino acid aminotransferase [Bacteroidota bacterium]